MPHVMVKLVAGRSDAQKQLLSARLTDVIMSTLGSSDDAVSVSIEDVDHADWMDKVYRPDIAGRPDIIYKKPGY